MAQVQKTAGPPEEGVDDPVFIQASIIPPIAAAAAWWVLGCIRNCAANPTGAVGGVGTKPAIPPPTAVAKARKAVSIRAAAAGVAKAAAKAVSKVAAAEVTAVDGGAIPEA
jgi:hypothetical protein